MPFETPSTPLSNEAAEQKPKYTQRELDIIRQRMLSDAAALESGMADVGPDGTLQFNTKRVEFDHRRETDPKFRFVSDLGHLLAKSEDTTKEIGRLLEGTTFKSLAEDRKAMLAWARGLQAAVRDLFQENRRHIEESLGATVKPMQERISRLIESIEKTELEEISPRLADLNGFMAGMTSGVGLMAPEDY